MKFWKFARSAGIGVLLVGVAIVGSSCAAKQVPVVTEEKPTVEEKQVVEETPAIPVPAQPGLEQRPITEEAPAPAFEEGKMGKVRKHKAHKTRRAGTKQAKGKKHQAGKGVQAGGQTVLATIHRSGSFKTFSKVLKTAGLNKMLRGKGPYTIMAPTDRAFAKLPKGTLDDLMKPKNRTELQNLLYAHIFKGELTLAELKNVKSIQTWNGHTLRVRSENDGIYVGKAKVGKMDIVTGNGVVHSVNAVIMPKSKGAVTHKKSSEAKHKQKAVTKKKE
ncbi:MAG: fasciclin domain-containing protein [Phycisphaerae bacterium]